jgi:hypothetical protein
VTHIQSRHQLLQYISDHAPTKAAQIAVDRGQVIVHGLYYGGWVISAEYRGQTYVIGVKPVGVQGRLVCGLLNRVPVDDYVGGETPLAKGDER